MRGSGQSPPRLLLDACPVLGRGRTATAWRGGGELSPPGEARGCGAEVAPAQQGRDPGDASPQRGCAEAAGASALPVAPPAVEGRRARRLQRTAKLTKRV